MAFTSTTGAFCANPSTDPLLESDIGNFADIKRVFDP